MGRNWEFSLAQGREKRLAAELTASRDGQPVPARPPLWSHDGTMQSKFNQGWNGVTPIEIAQHIRPEAAYSQVRAKLRSSLRRS